MELENNFINLSIFLYTFMITKVSARLELIHKYPQLERWVSSQSEIKRNTSNLLLLISKEAYFRNSMMECLGRQAWARYSHFQSLISMRYGLWFSQAVIRAAFAKWENLL